MTPSTIILSPGSACPVEEAAAEGSQAADRGHDQPEARAGRARDALRLHRRAPRAQPLARRAPGLRGAQ